MDSGYGISQFVPPRDLIQRLSVLPQSYLKERGVNEQIVLATTKRTGEEQLKAARKDQSGTSWPEASYLTDLHPVLEWATDRALASLGRGEIFAIRGNVEHPTVLLLATLLDAGGTVSAASWIAVTFPLPDEPDFSLTEQYASAAEAFSALGIAAHNNNPGPVADIGILQALIPEAVDAAESLSENVFAQIQTHDEERQRYWTDRAEGWDQEASALTARKELRDRRDAVNEQRAYLETLMPARRLVRPLLVVAPESWPSAITGPSSTAEPSSTTKPWEVAQ